MTREEANGNRRDAVLELRPSRLRGAVLAAVSALLAVGFVKIGLESEGPAYPAFLAAALFAGGSVLSLIALRSDASAIRLTRDGFEVRELHAVERYRWADVGPFAVRRRLLGKAVEFSHRPPDGRPRTRTLPGGYRISVFRLAQVMNEWRERAVDAAQ